MKYLAVAQDFTSWVSDRPLFSITSNEIELGYITEWERRFLATRNRCPSSQTIRNRIAALRAFYNFLDRKDWLLMPDGSRIPNPMLRVDSPKPPRKANDWLSSDETDALLSAAITPTERIIVNLLRWTGFRIEEARFITLADINLTPGRESIRIHRSKTLAGRRTLPLVPTFIPELHSWLRYLESRGFTHAATPLLASQAGSPLSATYIWRLVKRVATRAELRPICTSAENTSTISCHTLRRTFASDLLNQGLRIEVVSKLLGHANISVTQQYYAELRDDTIRAELLLIG